MVVLKIEEVCKRHDVPLQAAAIQFPFRNPLVSAAVLGMSNVERVSQNLAWAEMVISESFWSDLAVAV